MLHTLKRRQASFLFAVTAASVPLEFRMLGRELGWGLTFPWGLYLYVDRELYGTTHEFRTPVEEIALLGKYGSGGQIGVVGWVAASALLLLTASLVLAVEYERGWTRNRYFAAGMGFLVSGFLFVATRIPMYETVFVSPVDYPNWFTIPIGAFYLGLVGLVFLEWGRTLQDGSPEGED